MNPNNLIRFDNFFATWIENVNAVVRTNLIHFNSMRYNFDLWIRSKYLKIATYAKNNMPYVIGKKMLRRQLKSSNLYLMI